MSKVLNFFKGRGKQIFAVVSTVAIVSCMSCFAFAEDPSVSVDLTTIAGDLVKDLATQLLTAVGIVVAALAGFIALKLGIVKVIGVVKSITGQA